jgi:hypothetical protein
MDVFLTPLFGKWLPRRCNEFIIGQGAYSVKYNTEKLGRIASDLELDYAGQENVGSTWYSTPRQMRYVSYLTLINMIYLNNQVFSEIEKNNKYNQKNWPNWYYGVLSMYGGHLAVNHLWGKQIRFSKLPEHFDASAISESPIDSTLHVHTFYELKVFDKYQFKEGKYDNMTVDDNQKSIIRFYCLAMALESKRLSPTELKAMWDAALA